MSRWSWRRGRPRLPDEPRDRLGRRREIVSILAAKLVRLRDEPERVAETERWIRSWQVSAAEAKAAARFASAIGREQSRILDLIQQGRQEEARVVATRLRERLQHW